MSLDVAAIRADFPILGRTVRGGNPLIYLDSGATSQKPSQVLDAERAYNVDEQRRRPPRRAPARRGGDRRPREAPGPGSPRSSAPIPARSSSPGTPPRPPTWSPTRSATRRPAPSGGHGRTGGALAIGPGDEILITELEHHANLVPWQQLCQRTGATLRWFPVTGEGRVDLSDIGDAGQRADEGRRGHPPVERDRARCRRSSRSPPRRTRSARSSWSTRLSRCRITRCAWPRPGADFLFFSGHKMLAPTGVGVLWGRRELLEAMPPFITGGSMIEVVRMEGSTFLPPPQRFEAGVPAVAQAVGLARPATTWTRSAWRTWPSTSGC